MTNRKIAKWQNKSNYLNNYINCEWSEHSIQKAEIVKLDKNQGPILYCQEEIHHKYKDINRLKVKGWANILYTTLIKRKLE